MTNRADLTLAIQANTEALRTVAADLDRIGVSARGAGQQTTTALGRIKEQVAGVFGGNLATQAFGAFTALAGDAFKAGESLEQLRVRYTNLLGSSAAANAEITKLQQIANNSAFSLPALAEGEARLISTGKSADEARALMLAVGNTAAGIGADNSGIEGITVALTQMANKGRVSSEELNQLGDRGVNGLQILARALNVSTAEVQKLVEAGRISADTFQQAFQADSAQRFGNAMASNAATMQGILSTGQDLLNTLGGDFMAAAFTEAEPILARILTELQDPRTVENIKAMGQEFGQFVAQVAQGAEEVGKLFGLIDKGQTAATSAAAGQVVAAQSAIEAALRAGAQQQTTLSKNSQQQVRDVNRQLEDTRAAYEKLLDPLREKLRLENQSYQQAVTARNLARAQRDLGKDLDLAGNIFSQAGAAARDRLEGDRERVGDLQFQQAHQNKVDGIQDEIAKREKQRDAAVTALEKEKRTAQDATGATKTQVLWTDTLTKSILDQIGKVQAITKAYQDLADAQEGARESGRAAMVPLAIVNAKGAGGASQPDDLAHGVVSWIGALISGNTEQEQAAYAEVRSGLGTAGKNAAGATVGPIFADRSNDNVLAAYRKWQAGQALSPQEQALLQQRAPMGYTGGAGSTTSLGIAGATVGGRPNVTVNITTGPASQADWNAVADKIDQSLARHWGGP